MTNSPTPNPNRRKRLTADELIAIVVALGGIGTVFFWGIGQKNSPMNLLQGGISSLSGDATNRKVSGLDSGSTEASLGKERQTIASIATRDPQNPVPATIINPPVVPRVQLDAAPSEPTITAPSQATVSTPNVAVIPVTPSLVTTAPVFTDVPKEFWGATYITELQKRGILDDFGTGKFDPSQPITRGEYAKLLDRAFADRQAALPTPSFKDIPANYPRKEAIDKSVKLGFMSGYSATKFAPNQQIPRYQLQISLAKGLNLPVPTSQDKTLSKFADARQMPKYAREKMSAAVEGGLVVKDRTTGKLKPIQIATRADAAALIYQALVKEGKIQPQP